MSNTVEPVSLVVTTVATAAQAESLVRGLLARGLIACGTILPAARSLYLWDGAIADEPEHVVLLKTQPDRVRALEGAFAELHPYAVPELLALPVAAAGAAYSRWLAGALTLEPDGSAP
jgi:periplasmic divalent cation tolerance protein